MELARRLANETSTGGPPFGWGTFHRSNGRRTSRKVTQTAVDLTAFLVTPFVALVAPRSNSAGNALLITASALEAAMLIALGVQSLRDAKR